MKITLFLLAALVPVLAQLVPSGSLAHIGASDAGNLYIANDVTSCSPLYVKQGENWTPVFTVGKSGGLSCVGTSIDINPSTIPQLATTNRFVGLNSFSQLQIGPGSSVRPQCTTNNQFTFRVEKMAQGRPDRLLFCMSTGKGLGWVSLSGT
jgi:hypothetical protein